MVFGICPYKEWPGHKAGLEAVAKQCGAAVTALVVGELNGDGGAGAAGASKVLHVGDNLQDEGQIARVVASAAAEKGQPCGCPRPIGRAVAPRVAVRMGAGMVPGVTGLLQVLK